MIPLLGYADPPGWDNTQDAPGKRDYLVSISEETGNDCSGHSHDIALFWDITDPEHPVSINNYYAAKFDAERTGKTEQEIFDDHCDRGGRYGTHSTAWNYFAGTGDDPYYGKICGSPTSTAVPARSTCAIRTTSRRSPSSSRQRTRIPASKRKVAIQTNNLDTDDRGNVYLFDRANGGMDIIVPTGEAAEIAGLKPES